MFFPSFSLLPAFSPKTKTKQKNKQQGPGDASNYEKYPEDFGEYGQSGPDPFREKFRDF